MDQYELWMMRLKDKQNEFMAIPEWAKAEQFERCFPQYDIWPDNINNNKKELKRKFILKRKSK